MYAYLSHAFCSVNVNSELKFSWKNVNSNKHYAQSEQK